MLEIRPRFVLYDLDNTLVNIRSVFGLVIDAAISRLTEVTHNAEIAERFECHLASSYRQFGVDPDRVWPFILDNIRSEVPFSDEVYAGLRMMLKTIYAYAPPLYIDTKLALDKIRMEKIETAVVTHARAKEEVIPDSQEQNYRPNWTGLKILASGLNEYFPEERVIVADAVQFKHKDREVWEYALERVGLTSGKGVVVVDDSRPAIIGAHNAGIEYPVWLNRGSGWSVYREGELPEEIVTVTSLLGMVQYLESGMVK